MLRVGFEPTTRGFSTRGLCQLGYHSDFSRKYRRQDSNLQPPESESGASCRWATAANATSRAQRHVSCNASGSCRIRTCKARKARPPDFESGPRAEWGQSFHETASRLPRRRRESNPRLRLCRPAPRHSATSSITEAEGFEPSRGLAPPSGIPGRRPAPLGPELPAKSQRPADGAGFEPAERSQGPTV